MGIFKRTKASQGSGGGQLFSKLERERIDALWLVTVPPRGEIDAMHGALLERCWQYIAVQGGEEQLAG